MPLEHNQIKILDIWIHPGNNPTQDWRIAEWRNRIESLADKTDSALLEVVPGRAFMDIYPDGNLPEGLAYLAPIIEIERFAQVNLRERYQLWHHGAFVENTDEHCAYLKAMFNVQEHKAVPWGSWLLFENITVYGLKPFACEDDQMAHVAFMFGTRAKNYTDYKNFWGNVDPDTVRR